MMKIWPTVVFTLLVACQTQTSIENFDSNTWKNDQEGCNKERLAMVERIDEIKAELKGLKEAQIKEVLGKPDKTELYERGQRFYIYDITPDKSCPQSDNDQKIDLVLRLNALGIVSEASLQKYDH